MKNYQIPVHDIDSANHVRNLFAEIGYRKGVFNADRGFPRWIITRNGVATGFHVSRIGVEEITVDELENMVSNVNQIHDSQRKAMSRIEACQVLLDGGKLEYSKINSGYWSDVTNRDLIFTLNDQYVFRETPKYEFAQYTLDELATHLKTLGHKEVWVFEGRYCKEFVTSNINVDKIAVRAFHGEKFYKRVESE